MSYLQALNLRNTVTRSRVTTTPDGMGGTTTTTETITLSYAAIYNVGGRESYVSDQIAAISSHVLACRASDDIVFTDTVAYDGNTYTITAHPDKVMQKGKIKIVPLKQVN